MKEKKHFEMAAIIQLLYIFFSLEPKCYGGVKICKYVFYLRAQYVTFLIDNNDHFLTILAVSPKINGQILPYYLRMPITMKFAPLLF